MNTPESDTIAAIATASGQAAIAVVRVSGPQALDVADRLFEGKGPRPSACKGGIFLHGHITAEENGARHNIDEVVLLVFRAPHSYTGQDAVEIQCHGGRISSERILDAVLKEGCRAAGPGEFTRRAFLNGRLDLVQAEAVCDLIQAQSRRMAIAAEEQLEGRLSRSLQTAYNHIKQGLSDLEASLDFADDELPDRVTEGIGESLDKAASVLEGLLATWEEGRLLREGATVVISGSPNVGKSTLLNGLLGMERAIVTPHPGTTRDTVEETVLVKGIPVRLIDTAGIRATECVIEREGIRRAQTHVRRADLNVRILDASREPTAEDRQALQELDPDHTTVVLNKVDLGRKIGMEDVKPFEAIECCLLEEDSINRVRDAISERLGLQTHAQDHIAISERHKNNIQSALNELNSSRDIISEGESSYVIAAQSLRSCIDEIGRLLGRTYTVDLLDSIFSRFCIGK